MDEHSPTKTNTMTYQYQETYQNLKWADSPLEAGDYEACSFRNCDFSEAEINEINFIECEFSDCNLSNAELDDATFQEVGFKDCKLLGVQFEHAKSFGFAVRFEQCQLNHASFFKVKLSQSSFLHCQLQEVDFTEADMRQTVVSYCDLADAIFENTQLGRADFRHSRNYSIDPDLNSIKGARFSLPEVVGLLKKYKLVIE